MKNLMIKDLMMLTRSQKKHWNLIWLLLAQFVLPVLFLASSGEYVYFCFASVVYSSQLVTMDRSCGADSYIAAMPVSRADIVKSKYLLGAAMELIQYFVLFMAVLFRFPPNNQYTPVSICIVFAYAIIMGTVHFVSIFRFEPATARRIAIITGVALLIGAGLVTEFCTPYLPVVAAVSVPAAIILRLASIPLSVRLYEKWDL